MNIWRLMAHDSAPSHIAFQTHVDRGYIAVGWTDIGDLRVHQPRSEEAVKALVKAWFDPVKNADGGPSVWRFYALMRRGDLVIEAGPGRRHGVFRVTGDYEYLPSEQMLLGYAHARRVELTRIDPDLLWSACGKPAFARDENHHGTLAALNVTDEARRLVAASSTDSAEARPALESWADWVRSDRCVEDWNEAGYRLDELCPGADGERAKSHRGDESKGGRQAEIPALWADVRWPVAGVYRISYALEGSPSLLKVVCRVYVPTDRPDVYSLLRDGARFVGARYVDQKPKTPFRGAEVTGIAYSVDLQAFGAPGLASLRALFSQFIKHVLACVEGRAPATTEAAAAPDVDADADDWAQDEAVFKAVDQLPLDATTKLAVMKVRIQQTGFRARLLRRWSGRCSVTGLQLPETLTAAHIFPWAKCLTAKDRWSVDNGLLLHPGLDKAFEVGLVSFDDAGAIMLSPEARSADVQRALGIQEAVGIRNFDRYPGLVPYLRLHHEIHAERLGLMVAASG